MDVFGSKNQSRVPLASARIFNKKYRGGTGSRWIFLAVKGRPRVASAVYACICARLTCCTRMNGKNHIHIPERVEGTPSHRYWLYLNGFNAPTVPSIACRPPPRRTVLSLFSSLSPLFIVPPAPASHPLFPHRALTLHRLNPRRLRARTPVLRRLKHAVDKKQVCRAKRGAHVRQEGARRLGAISGGGRRGVNDRGGKRSSREPVSFPFFLLLRLSRSSPPSSPPFRPVSLSTIRYISTHPRHCFRGISSELFARDSFRVATRRLIHLQCPFPSPSRSRCYETSANTIENSARFVCAFLHYPNKLNGSVKLGEIIKYERAIKNMIEFLTMKN